MGLILELDAVNHILTHAGESPVTDLVTDSGVDVGLAQQFLSQASTDRQMRGITGNIVYYEVTLASEGQILLPNSDSNDDGVIAADLLSVHRSTAGDARYSPMIIARVADMITTPKLWNVTDDTDQFPAGTYKINLYKKLKWEQLDTPIQRDIMAEAARRYQMFVQGDEDMDAYLEREAMKYQVKSRGADIRDRKVSLWNAGPLPVRRIGLRGPSPYNGGGQFGRYYGG